jgi:hypothetical protein
VSTRPAPPSGRPPPAEASLERGAPIDLVALADEVCRRYRAEFPDEQERYGDAGVAWCLHDNQHILNWAVLARNGYGSLERELAWLARVLAARDFPLERLRRNLEIAADVVRERVPAGGELLADDLEAGARSVPTGA